MRSLTEAGIVATDPHGTYQLTELGAGLGPALEPLRTWSEQWVAAAADRI